MKRILAALAFIAVIAALAVAGLAWEGHQRFTSSGPLAEPVTLVVPRGAGTQAVARKLAEAGIIGSPLVFQIGVRLRNATLKAGEYAFPAAVSPEAVLHQLQEGRTIIHRLTIAEGLSVRQVLDLVYGAEFLAGDIDRAPPEGWLLPETWHLSRDDSRTELVGRMERSMRELVERLWHERVPGLPLKSVEEALVMASIVERETAIEAERPRIASVFINRLRLGMRLQSDPTVIYGLSDGLGVLDRGLTRADLATPHAWNTYVIAGLPPTPIANPGRASLEAVLLHPADTKDLYFVADGNGGHVFARTLVEHNRNVAQWRKIERSRKGP